MSRRKAREELLKEYEKRIQRATEILTDVSRDAAIPRSARKSAQDAIAVLQARDLTPAVRAANAIAILNKIVEDQNLSSFVRVKVWNVISIVEGIRD